MQRVLDESFVATTAVAQFQAVELTGKGQCGAVNAATDTVLGFAQEAVESGSDDIGRRVIRVRTQGVTTAIAGGAITIGATCKIGATGRCTATTTDEDVIVGIARTAAAADGDWFELEIRHVTL